MSKKRKTRLEDLAQIAGVSITTISRALNDSAAVNTQLKQQIWKLARENEYPFKGYMPAGPTAAAATLSIVIPRPQGREAQLSDPFILELMGGIGDAARARGCDILISHISPTKPEDLLPLMEANRANGVIFLGQSALHPAFNQLAETHSRFAVWGAQMPKQAYCSVGSDNPLCGRRATLHLVRLGRKRIVFLGDVEAPEALQRCQGYLAALADAGLAADPKLRVPAHFDTQSAEASVDALIARRVKFDAVFGASDLIALGAMRSVLRAGMKVPADVSVVGFDDVPFARYSYPALTTIRQDTSLAGRLLVSKLLSTEGEIQSERLPADLVVRESCGA
jgi:DNA-binding LacI/PurR family transcriptional regulator